MTASTLASWAGSSPRQKRSRAFATQYLSLILITLTMILPLYGVQKDRAPEEPLSGSVESEREPISQHERSTITKAIFPQLFIENSRVIVPDKLEVLTTFLKSHPVDVQIIVSGPTSMLPVLLDRAALLEEVLSRDGDSNSFVPVFTGISGVEQIQAEILSRSLE